MLSLTALTALAKQTGSTPLVDVTHTSCAGDLTGGTSCQAWLELLVQTAAVLQGVAGSSETEFLAIGARLNDFLGRAGKASELACCALDIVGGDEIQVAMAGLGTVVDKLSAYLAEAEQEWELSASQFTRVVNLLDNAKAPLAHFKKINKKLRMLGTATKIESARLGSQTAGFETLANEVTALSVKVTEKSEAILGQIMVVENSIKQASARFVTTEAEQRRHARSILEDTHTNLSSLAGTVGRCCSGTAEISQVSADVTQNLSQIVISLQFHDIVRQQIEHSQEALQSIHNRLLHGELGENADPLLSLLAELEQVCTLQEAQLTHAAHELQHAVQQIMANLTGIAEQEAQLASITRQMAGVADEEGSSFLCQMETGLTLVSGVLDESSSVNHDLGEATIRIATAVREIVDFINDIETIGAEIELIALNSQIQAAHTGNNGAALGVLAEAIQQLSLETIKQTDAVSDTLKSITTVTDGISSDTDREITVLDHEVNSLVTELNHQLGCISTMNNDLVGELHQLEAIVSGLMDDSTHAATAMTEQLQVVETIMAAGRSLDSIVVAIRADHPDVATHRDTGQREDLAARYTMHSERKIHEQVTGERTTADYLPSLASLPVATNDDEDLGANVELF